eukprot:403336861
MIYQVSLIDQTQTRRNQQTHQQIHQNLFINNSIQSVVFRAPQYFHFQQQSNILAPYQPKNLAPTSIIYHDSGRDQNANLPRSFNHQIRLRCGIKDKSQNASYTQIELINNQKFQTSISQIQKASLIEQEIIFPSLNGKCMASNSHQELSQNMIERETIQNVNDQQVNSKLSQRKIFNITKATQQLTSEIIRPIYDEIIQPKFREKVIKSPTLIIPQNICEDQSAKISPLFQQKCSQSDIEEQKGEAAELSSQKTFRSDVLYKTIMRDMRKFYLRKFNEEQKYIRKKRNKGADYFFNCLNKFFQNNFTELLSVQENLNEDLNYLDIKEMITFLACLLYPKDISSIVKKYEKIQQESETQVQEAAEISFQNVLKFKTIHSYLYQFTLAKLSDLINKFQFAYLYCNYYQNSLQNFDYTKSKGEVEVNHVAYTQTSEQLLELCQRSIQKQYDILKQSNPEFTCLNEQLKSFIEIPKKRTYQFSNYNANQDLQNQKEGQDQNEPCQDNRQVISLKSIILPKKLIKCQKLQYQKDGRKIQKLS